MAKRKSNRRKSNDRKKIDSINNYETDMWTKVFVSY